MSEISKDLTTTSINEEMDGHYLKKLSEEEIAKLKKQDSRLVTQFQQNKLEVEVAKNWDKFYKRNETRFFKDRHWTTREFEELIGSGDGGCRVLLECEIGTIFFGVIQEKYTPLLYHSQFNISAVAVLQNFKLRSTLKHMKFISNIISGDMANGLKIETIDYAKIFFLHIFGQKGYVSPFYKVYQCLR
ncbi:unnamed protein product, partial [Meganyctiphanes norvegica]